MLVIGENILDGKLVIVEARENGYIRATFPMWPDGFGGQVYVEVTTIPLLTAAVNSIIGQHP